MTLDEKLKKIFKENINYTSAVGIDNVKFENFLKNFEQNIKIIKKGVECGNYKFSNYKEKLILKGANKNPRIISIPTIRDKLLLKYIQKELIGKFEELRQKLPSEKIRKLQTEINKYKYFSQIDIENFYGDINHDKLLGILKESKKVDSKILQMIETAIKKQTVPIYSQHTEITVDKGLPQGLPISNILAEIYLSEFIKKLEREECTIIKYVDDIVILHDENASDIIYEKVIKGLKKLGLNLNEEKTKFKKEYRKNEIRFLGYTYCRLYGKELYGVSVAKENVYKFQRKIISYFVKYEKNEKISKEQFIFSLNNLITGSISTKFKSNPNKIGRYGWLFYYSQINDYRIPYNLDLFIKKILEKFKKSKSGKWENIKYEEIKSFREAFQNIREKKYEYIHQPDKLNTEERKEVLMKIFKINIQYLKSENSIERAYYKFVYKPMISLEQDSYDGGKGR